VTDRSKLLYGVAESGREMSLCWPCRQPPVVGFESWTQRMNVESLINLTTSAWHCKPRHAMWIFGQFAPKSILKLLLIYYKSFIMINVTMHGRPQELLQEGAKFT